MRASLILETVLIAALGLVLLAGLHAVQPVPAPLLFPAFIACAILPAAAFLSGRLAGAHIGRETRRVRVPCGAGGKGTRP